MLLQIGSKVRYNPERVRGVTADHPTLRARLLSLHGVITGWNRQQEAVVDFGYGAVNVFLENLEPD
jgi:hypothetical protein